MTTGTGTLPKPAGDGSGVVGRLRARSRKLTFVLVLTLLSVLGVPGASAYASANLMVNANFEALDASGFPLCWERSGWGDNSFEFSVTSNAHSGSRAMQIVLTSTSGGDRKAMMLENPSCAPNVTPGHQYDMSVWYMTTTPNTVMTLFRHDVALGWQYWTDPATLPVTGTYLNKTVRTPTVPPNTDQITWGVTIYCRPAPSPAGSRKGSVALSDGKIGHA